MTIGNSSSLAHLRSTLKSLSNGADAALTKNDLTALKDSVSTQLDDVINNYDKIDLNGDGITADELATYCRSKHAGGQGKHGGPSLSQDELIKMRDDIVAREGTAPEGLTKVIENFTAVDTDGDGKVSFKEFKTYADANGIELPRPPHGRPHSHSEAAGDSVDGTRADPGSDASSGNGLGVLAQILQRYLEGLKVEPQTSPPAGSTSTTA